MELISDSVGALPLDTPGFRHLPYSVRNVNKARRRTANHCVRAAAKLYMQNDEKASICDDIGELCTAHAREQPEKRSMRHHLEDDLKAVLQLSKPIHSGPLRVHRGSRNPQTAVDDESHEQLARSNVPMPCDWHRNPHSVRMRHSGEDADIAELYRIGLLYDDGEAAADAFDLNSIRRDEPVYSIRPAKRTRRTSGKSQGFSGSRPLHLDLSFADLGNDDAIARFLHASTATTPSEIVAAHDEAIQHAASLRSNGGSPPLRVIYELDTMHPTFDVETSQPPDLMNDSLSDYDCFSDSDLSDEPRTQDVHGEGGTGDTWVMLD